MFNLWLFPIIVVLFFLELVGFNHLAVRGVKPDLILILVIYCGWEKGSRWGETCGFVGGLLEDIVCPGVFGAATFTKTLIGYLAGLVEKRFFREKLLLQAVIIFAVSLVNNFLLFILGLILGPRVLFPNFMAYFYNALAALPLFWILGLVLGRNGE